MRLPKLYTAPSLADLYERHRLEFLRIERENYSPKFEGASMEERFTDSKGRKYYGFPSTLDMPLERYARMREFLGWLSAGVSGEELKRLLEAADLALAQGIKTGKNAARIGLVLSELRERAELVLHHELLVHFLAVQLIRQDEKPEIFDGSIHRDKVIDLLAESSGGHPFFFSTQWPELKKLQEIFNWSQDEWTKYWNESKVKLGQLESVLKIASKVDEPKNNARTSTRQS